MKNFRYPTAMSGNQQVVHDGKVYKYLIRLDLSDYISEGDGVNVENFLGNLGMKLNEVVYNIAKDAHLNGSQILIVPDLNYISDDYDSVHGISLNIIGVRNETNEEIAKREETSKRKSAAAKLVAKEKAEQVKKEELVLLAELKAKYEKE